MVWIWVKEIKKDKKIEREMGQTWEGKRRKEERKERKIDIMKWGRKVEVKRAKVNIKLHTYETC